MTSQIYTVRYDGETVILKLLASSERDEQRGALTLRYFDGHGAVRLLRSDDGAQLLEYAAGAELVTMVESGEDEKATSIMAEVIKKLHSVSQVAPEEGFIKLEHWFEALRQKAVMDQKAGIESIFIRSNALAEKLLTDQLEIRVLHGDIHHYNIKHSPRGWLAFDPKGVIGERTYDCANALCNPVMPELVFNETRLLNSATILADTLDLELWRVLAFTYVYACLNASWWLQLHSAARAEEIVQWHLEVANIIEPQLNIL